MPLPMTALKSVLTLFMISFYLAAQEVDNLALDNVVLVAESEAIKLQESSNTISIVDLENDQKLTADMGEVLSRVPGSVFGVVAV